MKHSRPSAPLSWPGSWASAARSLWGTWPCCGPEAKAITATARGYVIPAPGDGTVRQVACRHDGAGTRDELNAMVDCGCTVIDVIVDHPVYGQLSAPLHLHSRLDVEQFMNRMKGAAPLSQLTEGVHLHTLSCPDEQAYRQLTDRLRQLGFLAE